MSWINIAKNLHPVPVLKGKACAGRGRRGPTWVCTNRPAHAHTMVTPCERIKTAFVSATPIREWLCYTGRRSRVAAIYLAAGRDAKKEQSPLPCKKFCGGAHHTLEQRTHARFVVVLGARVWLDGARRDCMWLSCSTPEIRLVEDAKRWLVSLLHRRARKNVR